MNPTPCCPPPCSNSPVTVSVPGPAGAPGPAIGTTAAYGSGTYTLTTTPALLNLSSTPPSIILAQAGTYILFARARFEAAAATTTNQMLTTKLRCVNNTVADVANTQRTVDLIPVTATTCTIAEVTTPVVVYTAAAGDEIQLWGWLSALPGAGNIDVPEADIFAMQIAYA